MVAVMLGLYVLLLVAAAVSDLARFTIPDWVSGALAVLMPVGLFAAPGDHDWAEHLVAAGVALLAGAAAFRFAGVGGGDVKLFAALALWAGFGRLLDLMTGIVLAGGILTLVLVVLRRLAAIAMHAGPPIRLPRLLWIGEGVPYGVALAAGGLWQAPGLPPFAGLS